MKLLAAALTLAAGAACLWLPGYYAFLLGNMATTALVAIGLNILLGLSGEVSLGQVGFVALGAYAVGILSASFGWSFWAALPLAVLLSLAVGALLSLPALRLSGPYLAMVTIAFGFIVESLSVEWAGLTGGSVGLPGIPSPSVLGVKFGTGGVAALSVLACALALWAFAWLRGSPLGLTMRAAATAPLAARSLGVALLPVRTVAFVLSAGLAGLAGGLQAPLGGFIAPSSFPFSQSILFLLVVVLGGAGTTLGPLVGAVLVTLLPELLAGLAEYRLLLVGAGLLIVLRAAPHGVVGALLRPRLVPTAAAEATLPPPVAPAALTVQGLAVAFGGLRAVDGVGFTAQPGLVTSVIGPNGAGKTTLLNLISGFQAADAGSVTLGGAELCGLPAHAVSRAGVARSWQTSQLFEALDLADNLRAGLLRGRWRGQTLGAEVAGLLALVGCTTTPEAPSAGLAHVDRRLVEIARALATRPRVLLLDEPAAGLDEADTQRLGALLRRIAASGVAVVLVEHDMGLVMGVSDHIVVLDAGRKIAEGNPAEVRANPAVREAYLGHGGARQAVARPQRVGEPALDTAALTAGYGALPVLRGLDLRVGRGEMVALLGPNGAGKSTLMKALSGLLRPVGGHVGFLGKRIAALPAHQVARAGLVLVPEGRQVFPQLSVAQNMALGATRRGAASAEEIEAMLLRFPRLRARLHTNAGLLSGGEQQMLAIARGLLARPEVLLLDEPSLGLAPAVVDELFAALARMRDEGLTLLLVDQMAELALSLADRCYVLNGGRIVREGDAATLRDTLGEAYLAGTEDAA